MHLLIAILDEAFLLRALAPVLELVGLGFHVQDCEIVVVPDARCRAETGQNETVHLINHGLGTVQLVRLACFTTRCMWPGAASTLNTPARSRTKGSWNIMVKEGRWMGRNADGETSVQEKERDSKGECV